MNTRAFKLFALWSLASVTILAAEKDTIEKSFNVQPGQNLFIHADRGSITVLTADSDKVDIKIVRELKRSSDAEAREAYEKHKIDIAQDGDTVRIEAQDNAGILKGFRNLFKNLHVEYTVSIPSKFNVDLHTSGGSIQVADLEGAVKVHTSGGNLNIATIKGPIDAHTSGGSIEIEGGTGNANVHTSGGNIRMGQLNGDLIAKTSGGSITLADVKGNAEISTSGGNIRIENAQGTLKARTSGGSIKAQLAGGLTEDSSLHTTGGNIDLALAEKAAVNLNARTTGGNVQSDFDGEWNKQRNKLVAQVNGGGPELDIQTTGGSIKIRRN
jgi:hypothetical protein